MNSRRALLDDESHDPIARTEGRYLLGVSAFWRGDLARARHYLDGAIEAYDVSHRDEHLALYAQDPKAVCLVRLAWVELWAGDAGRADQTARSALEIAVDLDHLMTLGYVITYAAIIAAESEDLARLAELLADAELLWKRLSDALPHGRPGEPFGAGWTSARDRLGASRRSCGRWRARVPKGRPST